MIRIGDKVYDHEGQLCECIGVAEIKGESLVRFKIERRGTWVVRSEMWAEWRKNPVPVAQPEALPGV